MRKPLSPRNEEYRILKSHTVEKAVEASATEPRSDHEVSAGVLAEQVGSNPSGGAIAGLTSPSVSEVRSDQSCSSEHTRDSLPEPKKKNPLVDAISPFSVGLTIVSVHDASLIAHVRSAFTQVALSCSDALGLPMPKVGAMRSLYAGNSRRLEQARNLDRSSIPSENLVQHDYEAIGSRDSVDWCSNEGIYILQPKIASSQGWLSVEQAIVGTITPATAEGLFRIRSIAQQAGVRVMMFIVGQGDQERTHLDKFADEYIDIGQCEPDLGVDVAFSVACFGIDYLNCLGIGKSMCSITWSDGFFVRRFDPYISDCLEDRVMWVLRGRRWSLEEIGDLFKKNRSTVLRRLQGLPKPREVDLPEDWLSTHLEMLAVSSSTSRTEPNDERRGDGWVNSATT